MSDRPGRWDLLGEDGDPLPGDPGTIGTQATHYATVATEIRDQVTRLRQIAEGTNTLVGEYQPALRDSAEDLADHLEQAQGRFDTVASELGRWAGVFPDAHQETGTLLRDAEDAQQTIDHHPAPTTPVDPKDDDAIATEHQRQTTVAAANQDLARIRRRYHDLMDAGLPSGVKAIADDVAKKIDDASHDKLKDSFWDGFRNWIHEHAGLLKFVADVLTWIATAIVIVVLIVGTGGLGLAAVLLVAALTIHTMLAANGDGSWTDVALDAFALATLGVGPTLTTGAKTALALREGMASFSESSNLARVAFTRASGFGEKAATWLRESNFLTRTFNALKAGRSEFSSVMNAGKDTRSLLARIFEPREIDKLFKPGQWAAREIYQKAGWSGVGKLLLFGDKEAYELNNSINGAIAKYGNGFLLSTATDLMHGSSVNFVSASTVDAVAKFVNPAWPRFLGDGSPVKPAFTGWSKWADDHTVSHGGYW